MKLLKFFSLFLLLLLLVGCNDTRTIIFYDGDGNLISKIEITEGDSFDFPNVIEKEGHTFKEWKKVEEAGEAAYYMIYNKNSYTISYYYEGQLLYTEEVMYLENGTYVPDGKTGYECVFDKDVKNVTSNLDVNISYQKKIFKVVFMYNDLELETVNVQAGDDLSYYRYDLLGYSFNGWDSDLSNIMENMIVKGDYQPINYNVEYVLNNYNYQNIKWATKQEFIDEFYNDFFNYLTTNYEALGIKKNGITYSLTLNSVTVSFSSASDIKEIGIYDFEKTFGNLIYAPCNRLSNEAIIPEVNENYFLNSSLYLYKYQDLDRYFLNAINKSYSSYSTTYNPTSNGRVQIFFRFQQWQQGTNIPAFDDLPCKYSLSVAFEVNNDNLDIYNIENGFKLNALESDYQFLGWYDNELFVGNSIEEVSYETLGKLQNIVLYAMWDLDPTVHNVKFIGGNNVVLSELNVVDGDSITPPNANTIKGYQFVGWDKDYQNITNDVVISALYEIVIYNIEYDLYFDDIESPDLIEYTILDNYELPILERDGYLFLGWYLEDGTKIEKTTYGDLKLKAKWINFDIENGIVGNGTINLVAGERDLSINRSMNVYVKQGNDYIPSSEVSFAVINDTGKVSIDNDGFVIGISLGKTYVVASYADDVCVLEVNVVNEKDVLYVGHTGCRGEGIVQNTQSAFIEGGERGYYALECDVRVSKEGVYYIHHDDTFLVSGTVMPFVSSSLTEYGLTVGGLQASYRWDTVLSKLLVHKNGDISTTSNLITVENYLMICKYYNCKALLELKWTTGINSNDQSNLAGLVELVKKCGMYENTIFMTSMKNCLTYLRTNYPDATLQFLSGSSTTTDDNINWCIENKISLDATNGKVTKSIVEKMHAAYLYVNSYTVNSQSTADTLISLGVDFITTDDLK